MGREIKKEVDDKQKAEKEQKAKNFRQFINDMKCKGRVNLKNKGNNIIKNDNELSQYSKNNGIKSINVSPIENNSPLNTHYYKSFVFDENINYDNNDIP